MGLRPDESQNGMIATKIKHLRRNKNLQCLSNCAFGCLTLVENVRKMTFIGASPMCINKFLTNVLKLDYQ